MKPAPNPSDRNRAAKLLFFGAMSLGLMALVWFAQGHNSGSWPFRAWALFASMTVGGLLCLSVGVLALGTTSQERLRRLPAAGLAVFSGLLGLALLLGFISAVHSLFPSLDRRSLETVVRSSLLAGLAVLVSGVMLVFRVQSKRIQKTTDEALRKAHHRAKTNERHSNDQR